MLCMKQLRVVTSRRSGKPVIVTVTIPGELCYTLVNQTTHGGYDADY